MKIFSRRKKEKNLPIRHSHHQYKENFKDLVDHVSHIYREDTAFIIKIKNKETKSVEYRHITYGEFGELVRGLASYFIKTAIIENPIGLMGKNSFQWALVYFATHYGGGVIVPLDRAMPEGETFVSVERATCKTFFCGKEEETIGQVLMEKTEDTKVLPLEEVENLAKEGLEYLSVGDVELENINIDPNLMAQILFTSGTTSNSKAVMLSQRNILNNAFESIITEDILRGDVNMAFLPYHHAFGSTGQVIAIWAGITTTYCDGLKHVQKNIVEYKVSLFVGVPLLIETIYRRILANVKKQGKEKDLAKGIMLSKALLKLGIDKRRVIFKEIIDQLGGSLRYIISGASPLDPKVAQGLNDFGITTVQGYGLTESAPILCAEAPNNIKSGSVGKPMPSVELDLIDVDKDGVGQLIAKSPSIMLGYLNDQENTDKTLKDGWLYTGDLAYIDQEGFVFIKGREKNVIVLKNGKNVYPEEIEKLIERLPYVKDVMVFGDEKAKGEADNLIVACKIYYDEDYLHKTYGVEDEEVIRGKIEEDIEKINKTMPDYKYARRIVLTTEPMIKTSTGKIKRFEEVKRK